jgi:hypothetical protein
VLDGVLPAGVPAAVELPLTAARDEVLDVLTGTGRRAKLRTGGVRAALFPSPEELAASLAACVGPRRGAQVHRRSCTPPSGTPTQPPASSTTASSTCCWPCRHWPPATP